MSKDVKAKKLLTKIVLFIVCCIVGLFVEAWIVKLVWNYICPVSPMRYWTAFWVYIVAKVLFNGNSSSMNEKINGFKEEMEEIKEEIEEE